MTTIAYKHPYIAVDGRMTVGTDILTDQDEKFVEFDVGIAFLCGSVSDMDEFMDCLSGGEPSRSLEVNAIVVREGAVSFAGINSEPRMWECPHSSELIRSIGSGQDYAVGAMDHGATAEEAVAYAATRDTGTGGRIRVFNVETMEFVK